MHQICQAPVWPHFEWGHEVVCRDNDICPVSTGVCIVAVGDHVHPRCLIVISPSCECIARVVNLGGPAVRFWRRWWAGHSPCIFLFFFGVFFVLFFLSFFCVFSHIQLFSFWCCVLIIRHATRPWRIMPAEKLAEFGTFSGKFHACLVCG